jgi:hypothetical protein
MKRRHTHPLATWSLAVLLLIAAAPAYAQTTPIPTTAPRETLQPTDAPTATPSSIPTDAPTAPATLAPTTPPAQATEAPTSTPETPTAIATSAPPSDTPQPVPLQVGTLGLQITKTLEGSDLVMVGEYLTFTVRIRNTGSVTITTLPLIDEYDPAVLQPAIARFDPAPSTAAPGRLDWSDLTDLPSFGDLPPGDEFVVLTVFRAIGISDEVINRARVEAAIGSGGESGAPTEDQGGGEIEGGRVIVTKALVSDLVRADAPAISFDITIRNEGAADLVTVPIDDTFDPAYLRFLSAVPPPDSQTATSLRWNNILAGLGIARLRPGEVVTATTTFALLAPINDLVVNRVGATGVSDEFGNQVEAPRQADVRIRVIGAGQIQPTEAPRERRTSTPTATATVAVLTPAAPTAQADLTAIASTAEATATTAETAPTQVAANAPATLPATGRADELSTTLLILGLALVGLALLTRRRAR